MKESKRLALLRVLHILEYYTDEEHPLTQEEIASYLAKDYGIEIERKAVGRHIADLKEAYDYPSSPIVIESDKRKGTYIQQREFEDSELKMLVDAVLSSRYLTAKHSKSLIEKLCRQSNKYFRLHVKNVYSVNDWNKTDNASIFYNIELADEGIEKGKTVSFDYNKYGADGKLKKSSTHVVSPYQLLLHNQRYYLMAYNETWKGIAYYRMERITNMRITEDSATPLRSLDGYKNGIDYKQISSCLPYMYSDKIERVEFYVEEWAIDQVFDWFGKNAKIEKRGGRYLASVRVSPNAMEYWAMQYLNAVEVVSPDFLRERIKKNLAQATQKYE